MKLSPILLKYNAQNALTRALKNKTIKRKPCEVCGAKKVHGHHPDYKKPLLIIWLCPKHHSQVHAASKKIPKKYKKIKSIQVSMNKIQWNHIYRKSNKEGKTLSGLCLLLILKGLKIKMNRKKALCRF